MAENEKNRKSDAAFREERVLEFWKGKNIFNKTLEKKSLKGEFIFYEGPPTANGKPGIHHLEARAFKDAIPRYKTMQGFNVRRKGGWDTHGLPVELQVEKKLGLNSKKAIEEYGIAKFNQQCKESVWEYLDVWNKFTKRIGFWLDQENPYITYENDYIESLWSIVKKVNDQKLLYKDYKVVPWCPRCGTALSSHELAQGYEDVKDLSVYVKFKVKNQENTYMLAWTTTPWTLPGNVALAVGENIEYVKAKVRNEIYILAQKRISILPDGHEILVKLKSKDLIGLEYEPLFPFLADNISESEKPKLKNAYKVYPADFVNTEDGTGIVHTAVMYGQDDFVLGTKVGLPKHHLVNLEGKFIKGTGFLEDRFVKEKNEEGKPTLDVDIIKYLTEKNLFFNKENYQHSYPHCWRCHTALIYYARDSWYIKMSDSKIKKELISENKKINWEPAHTRDGRFGEWLKDIKDWAVSRERYWGTPLPVWICKKCNEKHIIGSLKDLKNQTKKSNNKYFVMRHGEAENNARNIYSSDQKINHLTNRGRAQVLKTAQTLKSKKITKIFSSPFLRTRETAEMVADVINFPKDKIIYDDRIRELEFGDFSERPVRDYWDFMKGKAWTFDTKVPGGESFQDGKQRFGDFLYEIDKKQKSENILIISHGLSVELVPAIIEGAGKEHSLEIFHSKIRNRTASLHSEHEFIPLPHNAQYELDLHRPYIDDISLVCTHSTGSGQVCRGDLTRTREVMDVWFDSGAMPFAQDHYPFENKKWVDGAGFPADYISEAIDQTRGWFYTLHAVGVLMERGRAYKNVICLGHLLDANGKKMSKSIGNVVDPWEMIEKYGVDTLRLWMYSVNQPGESKNFDEKTVQLLHQQVFGLLYNVLAFYELYPAPEQARYGASRDKIKSNHILDKWILARLNELIELTTKNLDGYKLLEPTRATRDFIGDLSTWYLRRSREKIKDEVANPKAEQVRYGARATLYFVLKTLAKIMAPLAPFTAEDIWLKLKGNDDVESVHLAEWPKLEKINSSILENMRIVRVVVSKGLERRQAEQIPVRQPLSQIEIRNYKLSKEYIELIKEELNVKEVTINSVQEDDNVLLFTLITPALKAEGDYREFMRELQDRRKKLGLSPGDKMALSIEDIYKKYKIMPNLQEHMLQVAAVASLICDNFNEPLDKEEIITACLLHDMGNIIKFKLGQFPESLEPEGLEYWQNVQNEFIEKYGRNEYEASIKISEELEVSTRAIELIKSISFLGVSKTAEEDDYAKKIPEYGDDRVNPFGIVSLEDRLTDLRTRYAHRDRERGNNFREVFESSMRKIEKQIFAKCKIKPEDINDESAKGVILSLRNFMIK
ncbi:hypothetical protein A3A95_01495 [Candidatus Nomurabacteria bacterium RIFCSPLOWO2_01_FULL_39_18]|uniref:isoleucine--tRNA ligase n=1 Tax=Candidatus Nomurabacteria bacterium RIFCSPHIGHO2_01_FULL_40_24b TaxID=1801739 RepID=A0A1F6V844_9BACT|nr:MAG: hypothetical protein A2647_00195 [Candidatus Nomurabacteria bacterium RIFCSPHIGHO2_01_FULL_40_24b]OGI88963.1 MAG: hypothetical protein A3A95_01495 [Candidatus Nomurabacteria bacterium RIFCSPLOWO2_01_FULL_39_18]